MTPLAVQQAFYEETLVGENCLYLVEGAISLLPE